MVSFDELEAAGIENARERVGLIKYLDSLGFTTEEMIEAEARGRLFGLAGDVLMWSGKPIYNLRTAAEQLGVPVSAVGHAWSLLGLTVADPEQITFSQADVEGLAGWFQMKVMMGDDGAFGFLRVLGAAMSRLAEAESTVVRAGTPDIQMDNTHDELATAQAFRAVAEFIPRISALVDVAHRHHLTSARTHFEGVLRGGAAADVVVGVGFADLSGFTALTQTLSPADLSMLLNEFIAIVSHVVHSDGGRVVKFIGDEVMWVSATPDLLAQAAIDLVNHPAAQEAGLGVRAGIGYGEAVAINGDYFGNTVNLTARLVGAAKPGQILAAAGVCDKLPDWTAIECDPLTLKGFEAPVTAYELQGRR